MRRPFGVPAFLVLVALCALSSAPLFAAGPAPDSAQADSAAAKPAPGGLFSTNVQPGQMPGQYIIPETAYAAISFPRGRPVLAGALELNRRLNTDFTYDPTATDVSTPETI